MSTLNYIIQQKNTDGIVLDEKLLITCLLNQAQVEQSQDIKEIAATSLKLHLSILIT